MAWLWQGRGTVKPQWSNCSNAFLVIQNWTGQLGVANRICNDAFDLQTKGSAGDVRGLNSAWRRDVNGLAIQSQMAQRPKHQCKSLQLSSTLMSKSLPHHCQQNLFPFSKGLSHLGFPGPAKAYSADSAVEVSGLSESSSALLKPSSRNGKAKFSAQDA